LEFRPDSTILSASHAVKVIGAVGIY
jgi:hypothetical protein